MSVGSSRFAAGGIAEHPLPNGEVTLVCGFPSEREAVSAVSCLPMRWRPMLDVVHGAEWLDAWREHFPVTRIGRFLLVPAWKETADDALLHDLGRNDIVMTLDPGRAFGGGGKFAADEGLRS